jgi:hypothetical protein
MTITTLYKVEVNNQWNLHVMIDIHDVPKSQAKFIKHISHPAWNMQVFKIARSNINNEGPGDTLSPHIGKQQPWVVDKETRRISLDRMFIDCRSTQAVKAALNTTFNLIHQTEERLGIQPTEFKREPFVNAYYIIFPYLYRIIYSIPAGFFDTRPSNLLISPDQGLLLLKDQESQRPKTFQQAANETNMLNIQLATAAESSDWP